MPPFDNGDTSRGAYTPRLQQKSSEDRSSRYSLKDSRVDAVAEAVAEYKVRRAIWENTIRAERRMVDRRHLP